MKIVPSAFISQTYNALGTHIIRRSCSVTGKEVAASLVMCSINFVEVSPDGKKETSFTLNTTASTVRERGYSALRNIAHQQNPYHTLAR